ncbi:MAG: hypothetical protein K5745_02935 [Saccharofermentans sp.]|nr:hypothetical protein [Saccharofermentans sp.]
MLAFIYILICALLGITLTSYLVPDVRRLYLGCAPSRKAIDNIPSTIFVIPTGIIFGLMSVTFVQYYITLGLSYLIDNGSLVKKAGTLIAMGLAVWITLSAVILLARRRTKKMDEEDPEPSPGGVYEYSIFNSIFYGASIVIFTIFAAFLMFYTYRMNGNILNAGYSTFSDLAPHTAMVSSFGVGYNFPTQYMHFSGDGIQYHFLFYFLCGTLEYLGLPIDLAINIPSIISMVCAFTLLGLIAVLFSGKRPAFLIAPILVLFRSSLNVFIEIKQLLANGNTIESVMRTLLHSEAWFGVTEFDSWGVWAINVYANQRHLMLGVSVILIFIILYLPFVRRMCISIIRDGFKEFIASRNAWLPRKSDPLAPWQLLILTGILALIFPYFHGSCTIAMLLILAGMALFSESRLMHIIIAVISIGSAYVQSIAFSGGAGNVVSMKPVTGFILGDEASFLSVGKYLLIVTGLTLILAIVTIIVMTVKDIIKKRPVYRLLLGISFLLPLVFAFCYQVTLEMLANHKFIQISLILLDAFVAIFVANLISIPFKIRKKEAKEPVGITATPEPLPEETIDESEEIPVPELLEDGEKAEEEDTGISFGDEDKPSLEATTNLPATIAFGDETDIKIEDDTTPSISVEEELEVVSETNEEEKAEEAAEGTLEHTAVSDTSSKKKGLPLPAWIAMEILGVILAILLMVPLTATGVSEWITYINLNKDAMQIDTKSPVTTWIMENTDPSDVFLTPMWTINRFTLTGRPMYYGWPYYAWSAGHDTYTRDTIYCWLLTGCNGNREEFVRYCQERHIKYVIEDPEFFMNTYSNGIVYNDEFFKTNFIQAAYFAEEGTTIYKIY